MHIKPITIEKTRKHGIYSHAWPMFRCSKQNRGKRETENSPKEKNHMCGSPAEAMKSPEMLLAVVSCQESRRFLRLNRRRMMMETVAVERRGRNGLVLAGGAQQQSPVHRNTEEGLPEVSPSVAVCVHE